ncbi:MAG: DUF4270 family protein [Bacteroidota bacterium]
MVVALPTAILISPGCEDPLIGVGSEVLPGSDLIETRFTDSLDFRFETVWLDTIQTFSSEQQLVGNYIDPQFGRMTAATYTQVLSRTSPVIGDPNLLFDSLVLKLEFGSAYGRLDEAPVLLIHEIIGDWPEESAINSATELAIDPDPLAEPTPIFFEEDGSASLSIRLSDELGRRLLYADTDSLGDRELFLEIFKGIYLATEPSKQLNREPGAILSLLGASTNTQLELHYREEDQTSTAFRSKIEPFQITSSTPRFHQMIRTESENTLLAKEVPLPTDNLDQFEFLQGVAQIRNFIQFTDPSSLGFVSINQAKLTLKVDSRFLGTEGRYAPPVSILAIAAGEDGMSLAFLDNGLVDFIGSISTNTTYNSIEGTYTLDLTRYLQEVLTGKRSNTGFFILPISAANRPNRAIFGGLGHPTLSPELAITYSTLPQ